VEENEEENEEEEKQEEVKENIWGGGEKEEEEGEKKEEEKKKKRWSRDKIKNIKNNAVIKYYFQNTVPSIIHVSNSSKQFLHRPYL